jgi:hypothetical protein
MLVAMTDMAASMHGDETETLFKSALKRSIDVVCGYHGQSVGAEEHKEHLAVAHAGFQIDDLIPSKVQQLLGGHLPQGRPAVPQDVDLRINLVE